MATIYSKLNPKKEAKVVKVKFGRKEVLEIYDTELAKAVELLFGFYKTIKDIESQYQEQKTIIIQKAEQYIDDKGTITFEVETEEYGLVTCGLTFQYEGVIKEDDAHELKRILGDRFYDLVRIKTTYTATPQLIEVVLKEDKKLAQYINIKKKAVQIKFK